MLVAVNTPWGDALDGHGTVHRTISHTSYLAKQLAKQLGGWPEVADSARAAAARYLGRSPPPPSRRQICVL
jgi:hypothetical protein